MNHRQERRLFDFRNESPQLLLVLDRKDDPITPLLNQVIGCTNQRGVVYYYYYYYYYH